MPACNVPAYNPDNGNLPTCNLPGRKTTLHIYENQGWKEIFTYLFCIIFPLLCKESMYCFLFFFNVVTIYIRKENNQQDGCANSTFQKRFLFFMVSKPRQPKTIQTIHGNPRKCSQHSSFSLALKPRLHQTKYVQSSFVALTSSSSCAKPWISPSSLSKQTRIRGDNGY